MAAAYIRRVVDWLDRNGRFITLRRRDLQICCMRPPLSRLRLVQQATMQCMTAAEGTRV